MLIHAYLTQLRLPAAHWSLLGCVTFFHRRPIHWRCWGLNLYHRAVGSSRASGQPYDCGKPITILDRDVRFASLQHLVFNCRLPLEMEVPFSYLKPLVDLAQICVSDTSSTSHIKGWDGGGGGNSLAQPSLPRLDAAIGFVGFLHRSPLLETGCWTLGLDLSGTSLSPNAFDILSYLKSRKIYVQHFLKMSTAQSWERTTPHPTPTFFRLLKEKERKLGRFPSFVFLYFKLDPPLLKHQTGKKRNAKVFIILLNVVSITTTVASVPRAENCQSKRAVDRRERYDDEHPAGSAASCNYMHA